MKALLALVMLVNRVKPRWFRDFCRLSPARKPLSGRHSSAASPPSQGSHLGSARPRTVLGWRERVQGVARALPKLSRTAQLRPHALSTGRGRPSLAWYLGGAATFALVATVGLVAYERQGRSLKAEAARPASAAKLAAAPQPTPPQKPPAPAPQPPPAVPAAAPAAVAPAPAAPAAPAPVRATAAVSTAAVAPPAASPAPVARPAAPAPSASDAPPVLAFAAPAARNEASASSPAPLLSPRPAAPQASPAPAAAEPASPAAASPAPASPAPEWPARSRSFIESAAAPTNCLPAALRTVLSDLAAKFPEVKVIATRGLQTDNHSSGSARAKMHDACMAVDIRTGAAVAEVTAYLRTRREIAGLNSYRNGVIHLDVPEAARFASGPTASPRRETRAAENEPRRVRLRRPRPTEPVAAVAAAPTAEATAATSEARGARRAAAAISAPAPAAPRLESDRGGDSSP